jgi:hypothetical protein
MERAMGIEPTSEAWEASILPLNYARSVWERDDSTTSGKREKLRVSKGEHDAILCAPPPIT